MPKPALRSRSRRKVQKKTPSGKTVVHYKKRKPNTHKCAICHANLHGKPRGSPVEIRKLSKSERKPERPFGGMLCSRCTRKIISLRARLEANLIKESEIPLSLLKYVK